MNQQALIPNVSRPTAEVYCGDAVEFLRSLAPRSVDLIVTDPAYESLEKHRAIGTTTRLQSWFEIFPNARYLDLFVAAWSCLKNNTHFYVMCDYDTLEVVTPIARDTGFNVWAPVVWDKETIGMGYHYRSQYEFVAFFEKGHRNLNDRSEPNVQRFKRVTGGYPTEKPRGLLDLLIRQSSDEGELVVDPFSGSFVAGRSALDLGRSFKGCDLDESSCAIGEVELDVIMQEVRRG